MSEPLDLEPFKEYVANPDPVYYGGEDKVAALIAEVELLRAEVERLSRALVTAEDESYARGRMDAIDDEGR